MRNEQFGFPLSEARMATLNQNITARGGKEHLGPKSISMFAALLRAVILTSLLYGGGPALCRELPPLQATVNDFAGMIPPAGYDDLTQRLKRFKIQSSHTVAVLTVPSLEENENIEALADKAFRGLPLDEKELNRAVLVVVARKNISSAFT